MEDPEEILMDRICIENGCYMFAEGCEWREGCEKRCRLEHGEPKLTRAGLMMAVAEGLALGQRLSEAKSKREDP